MSVFLQADVSAIRTYLVAIPKDLEIIALIITLIVEAIAALNSYVIQGRIGSVGCLCFR